MKVDVQALNEVLLKRAEIAERAVFYYKRKLVEINQETSKLFES